MRKLFIVILLSAVAFSTMGQRFDATVWGGVNMAQVDGDGAGQYNHLCMHAAINTSAALGDSDCWRLLVELGLTQKGSYVKVIDRTIDLLYVEVPIMLTANFNDNRIQLGAGVAPGVNVRSRVSESGADSPADAANYKRWDPLSVCLHAGYRVGDHWGVMFRWESSMLTVTHESGSGTYRVFRSNQGTFNRLISFGLSYQF